MKKKADDQIAKALKGLISRIEKTEQFVLDQAPDICKEMVKEETFDRTVNLYVFSAGAILLFLATICLTLAAFSLQNDLRILAGVSAVLTGIFTIPVTGEAISQVKWLYYLKNCTKLFLLKEFRKLIG